jgi:stearoyl-CoA desaturase (delta-9 desaturase)
MQQQSSLANLPAVPDTRAIPGAPLAYRHSLAPRPDRSRSWKVFRSVRGAWFLVLIHVGALGALLTGATPLDLLLLPAFMVVRGLATTVGYHRYFSHRSFKTGRLTQFLLGCLCCTNLQRGPLWWAAIHRHHHRHSDRPDDIHSPVRRSFLWAYAGWMFPPMEDPDWGTVRDLTRYPELVWLERLWLAPPLLLALGCWLAGAGACCAWASASAPSSRCTGPRW